MRRRVGACDRAENLRHRPPFVPRGTGPVAAVRRLFVELCPIDRPPVEARRRPGLEPRHRPIGDAELLHKPVRPRLADASPLHPLLAAEHPPAAASTRRPTHPPSPPPAAVPHHPSPHPPPSAPHPHGH